MAENTKIQWCDHTWNIVWGCTKVSDGCKNCYAEAFSHRLGKKLWGADAERQVMSDSYWQQPLKWNRDAIKSNLRRRVFCSSMADVFEDHPTVESQRPRLWRLIDETPELDWLLLTKRPENIAEMIPAQWFDVDPANVWFGATTENQDMLYQRDWMLIENTPNVTRFISAEPLLGPLDFGHTLSRIDWVIIGGESGHGARPMKREWAENIIAQCDSYGVPVFFKQTGTALARELGLADKKGGDFDELPITLQRREWPRLGGPFYLPGARPAQEVLSCAKRAREAA